MQRATVFTAPVEAIIEDDCGPLLRHHLDVELREASATAELACRHIDEVDEKSDLPPAVVRLVLEVTHVEEIVVTLILLTTLIPHNLQRLERWASECGSGGGKASLRGGGI